MSGRTADLSPVREAGDAFLLFTDIHFSSTLLPAFFHPSELNAHRGCRSLSASASR